MEDDAEGLTLCTARPEFAGLSEDEVRKALAMDTYGQNPITGEVARLGAELLTRLKAYADEHRPVPAEALYVDARCPIEKVAILTVLQYAKSRNGGDRFAALH
jgi:hypothetical protein